MAAAAIRVESCIEVDTSPGALDLYFIYIVPNQNGIISEGLIKLKPLCFVFIDIRVQVGGHGDM